MTKQRGFSLIEIMIVMAILGLMLTVASRKFVSNDSHMKSSIRKFAVLVKKLRNKARVRNKTYRIVFDLPEARDKQQSYWVESTEKNALLLTQEQQEENEELVKEDKKKTDPQGFQVDTGIIRQAPATLPRGLFFDSIELAGKEGRFKDGRIYIYFFPQGFVQESAIHLTDRNDLNWTLAVHPLTGRVDIIGSHKSLEDLRSE